MNKTKALLIIIPLFIGAIIFILLSGVYRLENKNCVSPDGTKYPCTPEQINKQVMNNFAPDGGYQPVHINMDNNEHYVILAKAEQPKHSKKMKLKFLLYNAKNSFFYIKSVGEPSLKESTLNVSIVVKRSGFFKPQIQSPKSVLIDTSQFSKAKYIDIHLGDSAPKIAKNPQFFAAEVGGHICTSKVMILE